MKFGIHWFNKATGQTGKTTVVARTNEDTEALKKRFRYAFPMCQVVKVKVVRDGS